MKRTAFLLGGAAFALSALAERVDYATSAEVDFALDTRAGMRTIETISELQAVAWNSSADWTAGGDGEVTATLTVTLMAGASADDPAAWTAVGESMTLSSAPGEGTAAWPGTLQQRFCRVTLTVGDAVVATADFDLRAAEGSTALQSLEGKTIEIVGGAVTATGYPVDPTVRFPNDPGLEEGRDYAVSASDNFYPGTARVSVLGIGDYTGVLTTTFEIVSAEPETVVTSDPVTDLRLDTDAAAVRAPAKAEDILGLAWNSAANWAIDGDDAVTATVAYMPMTAPDTQDPSTWTENAAPTVVSSAAGEGVATWELPNAGYYKIVLSVGDETRQAAFFDLTSTEGVNAGKPIEDYTLTLTVGSFVCDGYPKTPDVVVSNGTEVLTRDVDYSVVCTDNLHPGTATVTVWGLGDYSGNISATFTILPTEPETVATVAPVAVRDLDTRIGPDGELHLHLSGERLDYVTFNSAAPAWPAGGDAAVTARVRLAPVSSVDEIPADGAYRTVAEGTGEQVKVGWHMGAKMVRVVLELFDGESWGDPVETRVIRYDRASGTLVIIR